MSDAQAAVVSSVDATTKFTPVFHHVTLRTNRLEEMIAWHSEVTNMTVTFKRDDIAFLSNDAANHRIALAALEPYEDVPPGRDRTRQLGLHHIGFEYETLDELLGSYARLKLAGILPDRCIDHGPTISFYYTDPDKNRVELQVDAFGDAAVSTEFMSQEPDFREDPIGKPVDPDRMLVALESGSTLAEMHEQAYRGEFAPSAD